MLVTKESVKKFSPGVNIHTDQEFARKCGLPHIFASGAMFEGQIASLLADKYGNEWFTTGKMSLKFIAPVNVGDEITAFVKDKEVWCENQRGEKVVIGNASNKE